jgi:REP element-mobilizing transposase RayT
VGAGKRADGRRGERENLKMAVQKESRIEEGHLMPDHVHMMIAIPPKYAVSQVIGYIKRKSAIHLPHVYGERRGCEVRAALKRLVPVADLPQAM